MGLYTVDQVRHIYVATSLVDEITSDSPAGTLAIKSNKQIHSPYEPCAWFEYMSPNGDNGNMIVRSDIIPLNNIEYINKQLAKSRPLKKVEITFNPDVNGGNPVVGEDYGLRITFQGLGYGGSENTYSKTIGTYRAKEGDTPTTVLTALNNLMALNFKNEPSKLVNSSIDGDKLVIEEALPPFVLGKQVGNPTNFIVSFPTIYSGDYEVWGVVTDVTATNTNKVINGRNVADMEWFYMGERADQRRENGYMSFFNTKLLADSSKEYNLMDISYYYRGNNEDIQHSRKVITIAFATDSGITPEAIEDKLVPDAPASNPAVPENPAPGAGGMVIPVPDETPCEGEDCI